MRRGEVQRGDARRATTESLWRRRGWQAGARAGREWMGIRVRVGEGAPAGSYKAGSFWAGAGSLAAWAAAARSLPTVGRRGGGREGQADRWSGRAGPGRGRFGGPCRAARQAELAAQARPGARAVLGPGPVTSGPCRAWAVPGRPCSGRANGPRAVSSSIASSPSSALTNRGAPADGTRESRATKLAGKSLLR